MADEQPKTRIILQGNEQDLRAEITSLLAFRQLIQGYEFGHFVGYPIADYVRMTNENIKLKVRYETRTQPPWRPNENTYLPRPTYSIPNVATSKISWRTIKDAMGGKNGYDWGHWRVAAMLNSKRTIYCFGNTAKEAEKRLEELLKFRDFTIDIGEFAPLFSGLHRKLDDIIQRLERLENEINSVQLPNITWEVPSVGFGDPNLGTENSYPPSEKGLQRTFDHLGLILRGLGNTIAHNKSVIGEIGDVIGVPAWRSGYGQRVPATLPVSLRKEGDKEPGEIEIYTLTQL